MLWFGSALEFIPVKYVPNETTDVLGELHQFSSLLFQLLLKLPLKRKAVTRHSAARHTLGAWPMMRRCVVSPRHLTQVCKCRSCTCTFGNGTEGVVLTSLERGLPGTG